MNQYYYGSTSDSNFYLKFLSFQGKDNNISKLSQTIFNFPKGYNRRDIQSVSSLKNSRFRIKYFLYYQIKCKNLSTDFR